MIQICSACNTFIRPGEQSQSTKGRHRKPVKMHAECWRRKRAGLKTATHVAMTKYYKDNKVPCAKCKSTEDVQADHIVSRADGGSSNPVNYQPLCGPCNAKKGG